MRVAQFIDGSFNRIIQLPKDWKNILNFHKKSESDWNAEGFYRVVEVNPDPATEKKGAGYLDEENNIYTWSIISKTDEEKAEYEELQKNSDVSQQAIDQRRIDGRIGYDRIMAIIERKFRTGEITANQAKQALQFFDPLTEALNRGQWVLVQIKLNEASVPNGYQSLFNTIKAKVDNYVTQNY